ncbi:GNAT family N-acetyltransferase [Puia sp. P3]|uniref:GNAT family N-acetyltransferase n=1 Tax=Puia sp. P3 TaxID=3423952 RepID=UPI003D678E0F
MRCYIPGDAEKLLSAINGSLEHLRPWIPWAQDQPQEIDWTAKFIRQFRGQFDLGQDAVYGIFDPQEQAIIGGTGLHNRVGKDAREIGYWINVGHINQGYATEAVCALIRSGFEIEGLTRLEIHCDPENTPSNNIPHKLGFSHEQTIKNSSTDRDGRFRDENIWTLSSTQYAASPIRQTPIKAYDFLGRPIPLTA